MLPGAPQQRKDGLLYDKRHDEPLYYRRIVRWLMYFQTEMNKKDTKSIINTSFVWILGLTAPIRRVHKAVTLS